MRAEQGWGGIWPLIGLVAGLSLAGCGTPGAPLAPSLRLPNPVENLTAVRTGNEVTLAWTMPRKTKDKLLIKGSIAVSICRKDGSGACEAVPGDLQLAPNAHGSFTESLAGPLAAGAPQPLVYFVELKNKGGRSAGLSNAGTVLAGESPAPVAGLTAEVRKQGVVLHWAAGVPGAGAAGKTGESEEVIRLRRTLLTPEPKRQAGGAGEQQGLLAPRPEAIEQSLTVDSGMGPGATSRNTGVPSDRTLDKSIRFGRVYEYRAQRVARVTVDGKTVELAGPLSAPVRVDAEDVFPPAVPQGLAAVATAADSDVSPPAGPSIDLSWLPVTDTDLAGYAVYRQAGDAGNGPWQRISPAEPVVGPGFHDPQVQPGHSYRYAVTAIDQSGHESERSAAAEETVPNR